MLSIKAIGHDSGQVGYYANLGASENHDYYSEGGVRPGRWWGEGAAALGLEGAVSPEVLANVLEGKSADGKRFLVRQNNTATRKRRAGFDLTWSVPKSFSVLWSQLDENERAVLDDLAERALHRSLEAYVELCGVARRGKNGCRLESAKPVIAVFSHDTARAVPGEAPDANRHFHAVVANVCIRPDGTTGAIDARLLFQRRMKMALGAMFRAELATLLGDELGLRTYRPERGRKKKLASWWELEGVPAQAVTAMSKRRAAIEKWLRDNGKSGAIASEKAAVITRKEKERHTWQELNEAWQKLGDKHGFGRDQALGLLSLRQGNVTSDREDVAEQAVAELEKSKARFTENEILESAAVLAQTRGVGIDGVLSSVRSLIANSKELVRLKDSRGVRAYTTPAMLEVENQLVLLANRLSTKRGHAVPAETTERVIEATRTLRPQQARCIRAIAGGGDVISITGIAGSGKTFALAATRKGLERSGYSVIGTALASKAAKGLEKGAGIKSQHLHSLFRSIERGEIQIASDSVIVVDEAGMVGTRMMHRLLSIAESAGAKVVLVGDHLQLQAIDAGAPFRLVGEHVGTTELTQVIRQREPWARDAVRQFRDGKSREALSQLHARGQLKILSDRQATIEAAVSDWGQLIDSGAGTIENTLIFAGTNLEVELLNERAQGVLRARGGLGEHTVEIDGLSFHLGDRIIITKNNRLLGLRNGTLGEVVGAWDSVLAVRTEDGIEVEIDTEHFSDLDLSYAMNVHKGQGVTVENALYLADRTMTDREMTYVAASRAQGKTLIYADEESAADCQELADLMAASNQKEMAIEHLRQEAG